MYMCEAIMLCGRNLASLSLELATVNPASYSHGIFFYL